jgi:hypothetical protein
VHIEVWILTPVKLHLLLQHQELGAHAVIARQLDGLQPSIPLAFRIRCEVLTQATFKHYHHNKEESDIMDNYRT